MKRFLDVRSIDFTQRTDFGAKVTELTNFRRRLMMLEKHWAIELDPHLAGIGEPDVLAPRHGLNFQAIDAPHAKSSLSRAG